MTGHNIIDFVEGHFRRPLDHGFAEDLRSSRIGFDKDELIAAYSAWRQGVPTPSKDNPDFSRHWALQFVPVRLPPAKPAGHLRPYLPITTRSAPNKPNTGYFVFDQTEDDLWCTVDAIKHHLLYCHSVAIENPMAVWMMDKQMGGNQLSRAINLQRGYLGWRFNSPMIMARFVSFLTHVRPLVESGVLIIVEQQARDPWLLKPIPNVNNQALESTARAMGWTEPQLRSALWQLNLLVQARARAQGNLDMDLSNPDVAQLARAFLERGSDFGGPLKLPETVALATLINADLPALERLSIDDLVAIRRDSEEFENWRRGIEAVVRRIANEGLESLPASEYAYELSRRFRAEVLDLERKFVTDVSRRPAHIRVGRTTFKFAIGAAVGGVFGWQLGLTVVAAELVRDFAKTVVEALVDTEGRSGSSTVAQEALAGLFVAFSNE